MFVTPADVLLNKLCYIYRWLT